MTATVIAAPGIQRRRLDHRRLSRGYGANREGYDARRRAHVRTPTDHAYWNICKHDPCGMCGAKPRDARNGVNDVDHIENLEQGGVDGWENYAGLCPGCNRGVKKDRTLLHALLIGAS